MAAEAQAQRFLRWFFVALAVTLLVLIALVVIVDPYDLYGLPPISGFNAIKPRPERLQEEIKLTQVRRAHPTALILGNSRAEVGFDPSNAVFARRGLPAYNMAIPGIPITSSAALLRDALRAGVRPEVIIVGVDFPDFLSDRDAVVPASTPANPSRLYALSWRAEALFSLASVIDALRTLLVQRNPEAAVATAQGFNPLAEYNGLVRREGHYALFAQRAQENARRYLSLPRALGGPRQESPGMAALKDILETARAQGIEVHLVVYPYHAQILYMFEYAGLGTLFEDWKSNLARLAERSPRTTLWDFSGFGSRACERIPGPRDKATRTKWYWEAGHFKASLGNLMLERVLGVSPTTGDFGMRVDTASVAANRTRIARERQACETAYPELNKQTRELMRKVSAATHAMSAQR